jgi:hypothetical protein
MKRRLLRDSKLREHRSADPVYPVWVTGAMHLRLTRSGPAELDPARLELWRPPPAKRRQLRTGEWIYRQLKRTDLLKRCLGLRDLAEIQRAGTGFYRKHFGRRTVFGWKSVVRDRLGFLYVPYLFEFGDGVEVHWYLLEFAWERTTVWLFMRETGEPGMGSA